MRTTSICLLTIAALLSSQVARAAPAKDVIVWFTSHVCDAKLEAGTPGSSPELAIEESYFGEVYDAAAEAKNPPEGKEAKSSRFECKWVRITGFFTWLDYYHYRGRQFESAWVPYSGARMFGSPTASYFVERFADRATRRAKLAHRKVTLVGRFYDLCAAADRAQQASPDQNWLMVFGPCHYGNGMMLTDVRVAQVHGDGPQYLLGELNRKFFGDLPLVDGDESAALVERVRAWAASAKRGPTAYARELLAGPYWAKQKKEDRQELRDSVQDPDGYISYLNDEPRFRGLDPARARVAVFWDGPNEVESKSEALGCICLEDECADRWPLFARDADNFVGDAACIRLQRETDAGNAWLWR